jgi:hypothetical protein
VRSAKKNYTLGSQEDVAKVPIIVLSRNKFISKPDVVLGSGNMRHVEKGVCEGGGPM